jgi:hypothetical protein
MGVGRTFAVARGSYARFFLEMSRRTPRFWSNGIPGRPSPVPATGKGVNDPLDRFGVAARLFFHMFYHTAVRTVHRDICAPRHRSRDIRTRPEDTRSPGQQFLGHSHPYQVPTVRINGLLGYLLTLQPGSSPTLPRTSATGTDGPSSRTNSSNEHVE